MSLILCFFAGYCAALLMVACTVALVPDPEAKRKKRDVRRPSYYDRDHG